MLETYDFDNPWRKVYEWPMTAAWIGASALTLGVTKTLPVPTRFGVATSLLCAGLGAYRATQAWKRSQDTTRVRLAEKQFIDIPAMIELARRAQGKASLECRGLPEAIPTRPVSRHPCRLGWLRRQSPVA